MLYVGFFFLVVANTRAVLIFFLSSLPHFPSSLKSFQPNGPLKLLTNKKNKIIL